MRFLLGHTDVLEEIYRLTFEIVRRSAGRMVRDSLDCDSVVHELYEDRLVDAHFGGSSSPAQDRRLWRHLPRCERCRARYRNHALLESLEHDNVERARVRL